MLDSISRLYGKKECVYDRALVKENCCENSLPIRTKCQGKNTLLLVRFPIFENLLAPGIRDVKKLEDDARTFYYLTTPNY